MGRKGKRNISSSSQQAPAASSSTALLHKSSIVAPAAEGEVCSQRLQIPANDVSSKTNHSKQVIEKDDATSLDPLCDCSEGWEDDEGQQDSGSGSDRLEKRKVKKERQKKRKLAKKMAAKRRESELSLDEFGEGDDTNRTAAPRTVSLCTRPLTTLSYFFQEIPCLFSDAKNRYIASQRRRNRALFGIPEIALITFILAALLTVTYLWITSKDPASLRAKENFVWYLYWVFLGILSSVGLGTGLHTFILYLGPFIAKVSLAAQECSSLDFPQPPYPNQVTCPSEMPAGHSETISVLAISAKVIWETIAWGFGTSLGELPPYFVARAASLAGASAKSDDDPASEHESVGCFQKVQQLMRNFVMKVGFWGILLCASIPNPLFDLAGITCGHFQIPFIVFFGATAIGKTLVKSQLQMIFVILAFNEKSLEGVLSWVGRIPKVGMALRKVFTDFMDYQRATLRNNQDSSNSGGILKRLTEILVAVMILYFMASIITDMARSYQKRITAAQSRKKERKITKPKKKLRAST